MQAFQNDVPLNDLFKSRRKGNAKLQILVFGHVTFSFVFVTFRCFSTYFPIISHLFCPFYPKNSRLQALATAHPPCNRYHTFTHRKTPPPCRGGGPEGRRGFTSTLPLRMENKRAIMDALRPRGRETPPPLRGSSPCKAGQFIATTFSSPAATDFRFFSSSPPHRSSPASKG